jgi:hypothetical protein
MTTRNKNGRFTVVKEKETPTMTMLTFSQAASQYGIKKPELKRVLANSRYASIFTPENVKRTHYHDEVPDLIEISTTALDQYLEAKARGVNSIGNRATRNGRARKHNLYVPDTMLVDVQAALDAFADRGVYMKTAYKAKAKTSTNGVSTPQDSAAPVDLIEELIEA